MARLQGDFSRLLSELRSAGPLDRIRLLGRSLSALRGLSPWDRRVLLRMAGFEGAEMLVERLTGGEPETAEALSRALAEIEKHPGELQRTVRSLNDPKRRAEAIDELLATLDRAAAAPEPAAEEPAEDEELGSSVEETPEEAAPEGAPTTVTIPVAPPEPPAPQPPPLPEPPPPRPPPAPPALAPGETVETEETAVEPVATIAPVAAAPPAPPVEPRLPAQAPSAVGALECLLHLRRGLDAGRRPSASELAGLLAAELPFPWARRRAIQAWLAAAPADALDEALSLVDTLPAGSDRSWCLATLAAAHPWGAASWDRIAGAASGPAARRHLELRRRRS
jgi:outer membrane biosynthesis protein TonB